ncbi:hypothetical protein [Schaalia cardiffensis]|uniref:hypothetical protein n=1 Tax=Schaalia cardiffensis TaxID=181487 RepID=UPI0023F107C2|nr:hypothetical protein [Schaalia cardiffensis]
MSSYIVDAEHINVLVWAAYTYGGNELVIDAFDAAQPIVFTRTLASMSRLGQCLLDANARAVNDRYDQDSLFIYQYTQPRSLDWSEVEILKAINGYAYQAIDWSDWTTSVAAAICQRITSDVIQHLPGYDEATSWNITQSSIPGSWS